jgi:hypothetical protein
MAFIKTRAGFNSTPASGTLRELLLESVPHGLFSGWLKSGGPRDIIFAFLGSCTDSEKLGIYADYPKPCASIDIQLTKTLLSSRALGILSRCQFPNVKMACLLGPQTTPSQSKETLSITLTMQSTEIPSELQVYPSHP